MCRRNYVLGAALIAGGAGFLLSLLFSGVFVNVVAGIALIAAGLLVLRG